MYAPLLARHNLHLFNENFFRNIQIIFWHKKLTLKVRILQITYDNFYKEIKFLDFNFIEKIA